MLIGAISGLAEERTGWFILLALWLSLLCVSSSRVPLVGLQSLIVAFTGHFHLIFELNQLER